MQISGSSRSEKILQGQTRILNRIIDGDELDVILVDIIYLLESLAPDMRSSIILLDDSGLCLGKAISLSLPRTYLEKIQGVPLGPLEGSCGSAAYLRELVITSDITTDPRWNKYAE
ncbi:MAG: multi-sensor signal transduction histidine kinase, partial [Bacteroidota bacterium]